MPISSVHQFEEDNRRRRRIPKSKAVEKPTCQEILDILKAGGFTAKVESKKMFPRDPNRDLNFQGRVRVQLKDESGQPLMTSYSTRHQVMLYVAEMIPKLKGRQAKSGGAAASAEAESQNTGGGKKKKK